MRSKRSIQLTIAVAANRVMPAASMSERSAYHLGSKRPVVMRNDQWFAPQELPMN